jgi:hypothetical protein
LTTIDDEALEEGIDPSNTSTHHHDGDNYPNDCSRICHISAVIGLPFNVLNSHGFNHGELQSLQAFCQALLESNKK